MFIKYKNALLAPAVNGRPQQTERTLHKNSEGDNGHLSVAVPGANILSPGNGLPSPSSAVQRLVLKSLAFYIGAMNPTIRFALFALTTCITVPARANEFPQPQPAGSGTCNGGVEDMYPAVNDAFFFAAQEGEFQIVRLMLPSFVGGCPNYSLAPPRVYEYEHGTIIGFELYDRNAIGEGTYTVGSTTPPLATGGVAQVHGDKYPLATSGIVHVIYRDDQVLEGYYDITFDGDVRMTGVFSAGYCPRVTG